MGLSRREIDGRADIYALGMVVYEMLTGVRAFTAQDFGGYRHMHIHVTPLRPSERMTAGACSEAVDAVIMKALAKDPAERHQTAREFAIELQAAIERSSVPTSIMSPESDRIQVSKASITAPPSASRPSEVIRIPDTAPFTKQITTRVGWRHPRIVLPLTFALVALVIGGEWLIYSLLFSPRSEPNVDKSSNGQNPFPVLTSSPEIKLPEVVPTPLRPVITSKGNDQDAAGAARLIGNWQADVTEFGVQSRIVVQIKRNGTLDFTYSNPKGTFNGKTRWRLSDGILYESGRNGNSAGKIRWIDDNHMELTILYNQDPGSSGLIRRYTRIF